jgi:hypothetical protein
MKEKLSLAGVKIINERAENIARESAHRGAYDFTDRKLLLEIRGDEGPIRGLRGESADDPYANPLISLGSSLPTNSRRSETVTISSPWSRCISLMGRKASRKRPRESQK